MIKKTVLLICIVTLSAAGSSFSQQAIFCKQNKHSHSHSKPVSGAEQKSVNLFADTARSDSNNILKTTINLQVTDFTNKIISGNTQIDFIPKVNGITTLSLDLLKLIVDSIEVNNSNLSYSYNDTLLVAHIPSTINIGDTTSLTVFYHGTPQVDPQWGGFIFQSGEAFNLGVGFAANPHVYGRVWFPCFDNFVERCSYEFNIKTNAGKIAYANGLLTKDTIDANGLRTRTWVLNEEIPSYLAGVSIGNYTQVNQSFVSISGDTIPIVLSDIASDTTKLKNSFIHLTDALNCYENAFGPYLWPKVGYMMVLAGAMEHPTAVSYPRFLITGNTQNEDIMAHELSHHWWGDLATCHSQEEMWINEGIATFSQYYFFECVYGATSYKNQIRANHENLIHYVHLKEGGYRSLDAIPHSLTYGEHVYNKGADVAHTMRGYLGDSLFFAGLKYVLANNKYTDMSNEQFRDDMTAGTGVNMNDFFNGWVFNGGWPHFSIDSFSSAPNGGNYDVTVHIKQKLDGAPNLFNNVPLEITFKDAGWNETARTILVSGASTTATVTIPINPVFAGVDMNEKISDAVTSDMKTIKTTGNSFSSIANGRMQITVQAITPNDSAFVFVEHNWATADSFKTPNPNYKLSPYHYWKVSGMLPALFDATGLITYDGRATMSSGNGYMDHHLLTATNQEDSIVLMYRKNAGDEWALFPYYTKTMNNLTDKFGTIKIDSLLLGEYSLAFAYVLGNAVEENINENSVVIYPNPSNGEFSINGIPAPAHLCIYNTLGQVVFEKTLTGNREIIKITDGKNGIYFCTINSLKGAIFSRKIIIK